MSAKNRKLIFRSIFGLAVLSVVWGWLWLIQQMLEGEQEAAVLRVARAERVALNELTKKLENTSLLHSSEKASAVWVEGVSEIPKDSGVWPSYQINSSEELLKKHREKDLPSWGILRDGRDWLGGTLLKVVRQERMTPRLGEIFREGIFSNSSMNPGMRLLLIRELEKIEPSPALSELKLKTQIQAVEGNVSELAEPLEIFKDGKRSYFYTRKDLLATLEAPLAELTTEIPEERLYLKTELSVWPYLSLRSVEDSQVSAQSNAKALTFVGVLTGILIIVIVFGSLFLSHREYQRARARTDLAASVAHELRTPLAGQRVLLESLLKRVPQEEEYLTMSLRENERLGLLAEEFLTFSRLERGVMELRASPCDLRQIMEDVLKSFPDEISLVGEGVVTGDEAAIATIARNLIENAVKYSDLAHEIEVTIFSDGFRVSDQGIGLSRKDQEKIFRQFYRVDQDLSRSEEGLGLGLAIVKRLADGMGAELSVESELGKGSAFTVKFVKGGER